MTERSFTQHEQQVIRDALIRYANPPEPDRNTVVYLLHLFERSLR